MDKALEDGLRWFLTFMLNLERDDAWRKIESCEKFLEDPPGEKEREEVEASLAEWRARHRHRTELRDALEAENHGR